MLTQADFEKKFRAAHGDRYGISEAVYNGKNVKVSVWCNEHGEFKATPSNLYKGRGCPRCAKRYRPSTAEFIERAVALHGNRYDYSKVKYRTMNSHVTIACTHHGEFRMYPRVHLRGCGCPLCVSSVLSVKFRMRTDDFVRKATAKHGGLFDYSRTVYGSNQNEPVTIICKKHGEFLQKPSKHLSGRGCQQCKATSGELAIYAALKKIGVDFESEKRFPDCRDKKPLPFDVWIPSQKTLIEFDGPQHQDGGSFWVIDGEDCRRRDKLKNEYASRNGYRLIRIPWKEKKNIERIILAEIGRHSEISPVLVSEPVPCHS